MARARPASSHPCLWPLLYNLIKRRYQGLREPEAKDQFRPRHQQLRRQPLEEARDPLVPHHAPDDPEPALRVLKIPVLDARLDHVQRGRHDQGGRRAGDRGDEVLQEAGRVVVVELVQVLLRGRGAAEEGERAGGVAGGGPAGAPVEAHAFVGHDAEDAAAAEGVGVGLAFDLQDVEGEEDDLADADQAVRIWSAWVGLSTDVLRDTPSGSRMHDSLAVALSERSVELVPVMQC